MEDSAALLRFNEEQYDDGVFDRLYFWGLLDGSCATGHTVSSTALGILVFSYLLIEFVVDAGVSIRGTGYCFTSGGGYDRGVA